jgi:enoyl-[acyl-carrier protein] reductase I
MIVRAENRSAEGKRLNGSAMDFLDITGKYFVVFGLANKKSIAAAIAATLISQGATVLLVVRSEQRRSTARKLFPDSPVFICDVEDEQQIERVSQEIADELQQRGQTGLAGIVHSIAFANYSAGVKPFHETDKNDFLQSFDISCFSFISIANHFKDLLAIDASLVTISISTTRMAATNYGYMAPIKAALDSSLCFLAKSFSEFSRIRFNAVAPSLLKTSASAGIPGYIDSYLFAEKAMLRKQALTTQEAADAAVFLLSNRSSGINCQTIVVDGGMGVNYFDREIIKNAVS